MTYEEELQEEMQEELQGNSIDLAEMVINAQGKLEDKDLLAIKAFLEKLYTRASSTAEKRLEQWHKDY